MQSRNWIIGVAAVVLIALGIWYFTSASGGSSPSTMATSTPEVSTTTPSTTSTSTSTVINSPAGRTVAAYASQTSNFTCTLSAVSSSGTATGVIYGAGGKIRVDFTIPSNNGSVVSHIIRSGGYSYSWVDGQTTGTKAAITSESPITAPAPGGAIALDSGSASECHPWVPDSAQLTPPSGISFVAR